MTINTSASPSQYDRNTILLHWLTAFIVIYQFLSAELWDYFGHLEKHFLIVSHMSLGFLLAVLLTIRIVWRYRFGIRILETVPTLFDRGAKALHFLLYALLVIQMPLGFFTRWTDNQPLNVFGLLISSPIGVCTKSTGHLVDQIHDINAWIIIGLVGIHAAAALVHYYFWHDEVLQRMLPGLRKSQRASL
jgi:cytochrome b561